MGHLSYAAMLAFVLVGTLPLHRLFGLSLLRQVRRVALAVLPVAVVFVAWDVAATAAGHWAFDPAQVLAVRVLGLPLEEVAFFVVIPLAGLLTYEAVGVVLREGGVRRALRWGGLRQGGRQGGPQGGQGPRSDASPGDRA